MRPGRGLGIVLGLIIFFSLFALPVGQGPNSPALYDIMLVVAFNLSQTQSTGNQSAIGQAYAFLASFGVLLMVGVLGVFPLATGILGIAATSVLTVMFGATGKGGVNLAGLGPVFYVLWSASVALVAASFWRGKVPPVPPPAPIHPTATIINPIMDVIRCPSCGTQNPSHEAFCGNCGKKLKPDA
jgi:hypothetical protein